MALAPSDLILAFLESSRLDAHRLRAMSPVPPPHSTVEPGESRVAFGLRAPDGAGGGYVRVWGPSATDVTAGGAHVTIEVANGLVGLRDPLHHHVPGAVPRVTAADISHHAEGFGGGPKYGPFTHSIPASAMGPGALYPDARSVVRAVLAAFAAAGWAW